MYNVNDPLKNLNQKYLFLASSKRIKKDNFVFQVRPH